MAEVAAVELAKVIRNLDTQIEKGQQPGAHGPVITISVQDARAISVYLFRLLDLLH